MILSFLTDVFVPLAWPFVVLIGLLVFRKGIRDGLKRLFKAGPTGVEMIAPVNSQSSELPETLSSTHALNELGETEASLKPWLEQVENHVKENPKYNNIPSLKKIAAISRRQAYSENIFRLIFGSQLKAIERLIDGPKSIEQLSDLYESHKEEAGQDALPTPEAWAMFLLNSNLATMTDGKLNLSEFGKSFYDVLIKSRYSVQSKAW